MIGFVRDRHAACSQRRDRADHAPRNDVIGCVRDRHAACSQRRDRADHALRKDVRDKIGMFVIEKSVIEKSLVEKASERYQESRSQLNPQPPQLALSFPPEVVRGAFGIPQSPSRQIFSFRSHIGVFPYFKGGLPPRFRSASLRPRPSCHPTMARMIVSSAVVAVAVAVAVAVVAEVMVAVAVAVAVGVAAVVVVAVVGGSGSGSLVVVVVG